jgi:acetyl esterase/lipase
VWHREANLYGWDAYLGGTGGNDDVSIYASPTLAADLSRLPPAHINVGDLDMFLDEDVAYAMELLRAGVPCELHVYPGAFHGSNGQVVKSPLSKRWNTDEQAALTRALGA